MKRLLAYLFIVLGLGLILNINANAANTKKIDYLCISQNKDNKKEYVKHKDDEYIFQVFYKNKLLNLQKNKNCTFKVFSTDPIFQPLFDTLSDKNVGKKILVDSSWGLTKTIKKKIFLKEYEDLKTAKIKPSQSQEVVKENLNKIMSIAKKTSRWRNDSAEAELRYHKYHCITKDYKKVKRIGGCGFDIDARTFLDIKMVSEVVYDKYGKDPELFFKKLLPLREEITQNYLDKTKTQIAKAEPSQTQKVASKDQKHLCVNEFNEKLMRVDKILKDQNNKCKYKAYK